ncbi:hypothetical protein BP5796_08891 [Coleophoma crateriformis]|uniref:Uncharacterized protein n=1 Tax=Coleophoma crateriformis TaxID=565419 RepID=A0A3D8R345_9HELO|nr:hypothetical protein BP5796_08891 [Coleophoma crateriformis]
MSKAKGKPSKVPDAPPAAASTQYTGAAAPPPMNNTRPRQDDSAADSYDDVPEAELVVAAKGVVLSRYRDRDEWGNLDDDYWTMDLRMVDWPAGSKALKARSEEDMVLEEGKAYAFHGAMYLDPGKQWTSTFLLIKQADALPQEQTSTATTTMAFEIEARVQAVQAAYCVVSWQAEDDYENTEYGQAAKICFGEGIAKEQRQGILHRVCTIGGTMTSENPDDNTWVATRIVISS